MSGRAQEWVTIARKLYPGFDKVDLVMISPCAGVDTGLMACRELGIKCRSVAYEINETLKDVLEAVHGDAKDVHVGPFKGNFENIWLPSLPTADVVCAGPPCPPFSRNGDKMNWEDARSRVFGQCMLCIKEQSRREATKLRAFVIENVRGICDKGADGRAPIDDVLDWCREELCKYGWNIFLWGMNADKVGLPQSRPRTYLCGRKMELFIDNAIEPAPPKIHIKNVMLRSLLDEDAPQFDESLLTSKQAHNLTHFRELVKDFKTRTSVPDFTLAVFDLTRAPDKKRKPLWRIDDKSPCLLTNNTYLWVETISSDVKHMSRFLSQRERARLQGLPDQIIDVLPLTAQAAATGNAMAMPCVGLCLAAILSKPH